MKPLIFPKTPGYYIANKKLSQDIIYVSEIFPSSPKNPQDSAIMLVDGKQVALNKKSYISYISLSHDENLVVVKLDNHYYLKAGQGKNQKTYKYESFYNLSDVYEKFNLDQKNWFYVKNDKLISFSDIALFEVTIKTGIHHFIHLI